MLVDSHCHLDYLQREGHDLDEIIDRASANNIKYMLTIATNMGEYDQVLKIAKRYDNIYCTVGTHPHNAADDQDVTIDQLVELTKHPKVIGIGETGLDYFYDNCDRDIQRKIFIKHIEVARITQLPLIVHARDADHDTIKILQDEYKKGKFPGIIHCFTASRELAEKSVDIGFKISLSGIITFKSAGDINATVKDLKQSDILVETDAPFLAPIPMRGKKNEPSFMIYTAEKLAQLQGVTPTEIAEITTNNFFNIFTKAIR